MKFKEILLQLTELKNDSDLYQDPNAYKWNKNTKRGIKQRAGSDAVADSENIPEKERHNCKHEELRCEYPFGQHRGIRDYYCKKCGKKVKSEDSTD